MALIKFDEGSNDDEILINHQWSNDDYMQQYIDNINYFINDESVYKLYDKIQLRQWKQW